jgi:homoserine dehydrogenase
MEKTHVAIVGMGTVGSGVARLLLDHGDRLARHAGRVLWLNKALVRDLSKDRGISGLPAGVLTNDLQEILGNPQIQVVAHLIGGIEPARTIMLKLLESGKDVVTANKALLAQHGEELFDRARSLGRTIAFEASVGGGIPIIANITQCFTANQIISLQGILNGTSNFILTQMSEKGLDYDRALEIAQNLGYAEADPAMDVDGSDAAQKLAILAHLARALQRHYHCRRCRGGYVLSRPRCRADAHCVGRGGRHDRYGSRTNGHHFPSSATLVGPPMRDRVDTLRPDARSLLHALPRGRRTWGSVPNHWDSWELSHLDFLDHPA